jgi:hypothetical protein
LDFIVSTERDFAIEKLGKDKFNIITDVEKIEKKLAELEEKEKAKKPKEETKPKPSPEPKEETKPEERPIEKKGRKPRGMADRKPKVASPSLVEERLR